MIFRRLFAQILPWGQMSFWAAQVIMSLFGSIPYIGEDLLTWIRGDYLISGITLNRLFAFHVVLLPLALIAVVFVHILALYFFGGEVVKGFVSAMIWGVFIGTYSSIFIASPLIIIFGFKKEDSNK